MLDYLWDRELLGSNLNFDSGHRIEWSLTSFEKLSWNTPFSLWYPHAPASVRRLCHTLTSRRVAFLHRNTSWPVPPADSRPRDLLSLCLVLLYHLMGTILSFWILRFLMEPLVLNMLLLSFCFFGNLFNICLCLGLPIWFFFSFLLHDYLGLAHFQFCMLLDSCNQFRLVLICILSRIIWSVIQFLSYKLSSSLLGRIFTFYYLKIRATVSSYRLSLFPPILGRILSLTSLIQ